MKTRRQAQILIIALTVLLTGAGIVTFNRTFMQAEAKGFVPAAPDTTANGWDTQFSLPNGLSGQVSAMLASGTNIYVSGGLGPVLNAPPNNFLLKFDTLTQTWTSLGTVSADGAIRVMALSGSDLYVGGFFTTVDVGGTNVPANNVAKLNLTTGVWSALGTGGGQGVSGSVYAITLSGSDLYVGGVFLTANVGGASVSVNRVAKFNTVTGGWSALGTGGGNGVNSIVTALLVSGSDLYAGGSFATANVGGTTVTANGVTRFNTLTGVWSALGNGGGQGIGNQVLALELGGNDLYVGGNLSLANIGGVTVPVSNLAKFNTATGIWSAVGAGGGNGVDASVDSLLLSGNELYVGGGFTTANVGGATVGANRIAKINTSTGVWSALGTGGNGVSRGGGAGSEVSSLVMIGSRLYAGGNFTSANEGGSVINVSAIAKFDTATSLWSGLTEGTGNGLNDVALAVAVNGTDIYVGGIFSFAGSVPVNGIARFDTLTNTWSSLGTGGGNGVNGSVYALALSGGDLYVGGTFTAANAGGATVNVNNVAKVNLATGVWSALGTGGGNGVSSGVRALLVSGGDLYVGGGFTTANVGGTPVNANRVAKFNPATGVWSALGTGGGNGVNDPAYALAASGGNLYVGGLFTTANVGGATVSVNKIARVNLTTGVWTALGTGGGNGVSGGFGPSFIQGVYALAANNSDLYAGGNFAAANTGGTTVSANYIAKVNLTTGVWSALGTGGGNGLNLLTEYPPVSALALNGNDLYAAGAFTMANIGGPTVNANSVAKFNTTTGNWSALADSGGGNGVNFIATSLGLGGNDVFVGGTFSMAGDNKPSANIARFHTNTAPTITAQASVSRQQGSPASSAQIATVNDAESGAGGVTVTVSSANPSNGVTISSVVNSGGMVTADVVAACGATNASFTLTATDGDGATATATLNVTVTANTAPVFSYGSPQGVLAGGSVTATPTSGPSDNGTVVSIVLQSQSAFTGAISVNNSTGEVSISNAAPVGAHTIVVRATDNCGATTDGSFTLNVSCPAITLSPATLSNAAAGTIYNQALTANPAGTYSFALINGQLPKGLTLSAGGGVSGTPTEFGIFTFTVAASTGSCSGSRAYTLSVIGTSCAVPNFTNRGEFVIESFPVGIITADFNKDGNPDLVTSNLNTNDLTLLIGNGAGGFPTGSTITPPNGDGAMATGDFNSDENLDLVVASTNTSVLFGNGAGGLPTSTSIATGGSQRFVFTGDFNRDGKLDFLTASGSGSNQLAVRLGDGAGGFSLAPGSPLALGFSPIGITLNDFNQDGKLDVGIGQSAVAQVSVFSGVGDGSFTVGAPLIVNTTPANVGSADFNLDGKPDLAVAHTNDSLTILFGDGAGGFSVAPGSPLSAAAAYFPSDFNGDGIPDLANTNRVAYGNGSGGFTVVSGLNTGSDRRGMTAGDLNGDGKPDLAVVNSTSNRVVVVFNNCAPQITAGAMLTRQQGSPATNAQIATVSDQETAASNLIVTATSVPSGLTVMNIVNTGGVITADVAANCAISSGAKTVVLQVSDGALTATANLTVNVTANTAPSLTFPASANVTAGGSTTINPITATDNVSITGYSIASVVPALTVAPTVNPSGVVSITNAGQSGSYVITVRAMDNCGAFTDASFTLNVDCQTVTINQTSLPNGFVGTVYNQTLTAAGGAAPYSFTVSAGALPAGVTLSSGGALSGTPTTQASFTFTIRATDANGCFGERNFTVLVSGNGLMFYPLPSPVRLLDTRTGFSGCTTGVGALAAGSTRTEQARTVCSTIPANATAVIGNITVVPSGPGFLTLFPSDATQPTVANSNFKEGEITNNFFTVGLGTSGADAGAFKIFTSATTDVIIDVTGYYAPPAANGLFYHPLPSPVRLVETRAAFSGCFQPAQLQGTNNPNANPNLDLEVSGRGQGLPSPCNSIPGDAVLLVGNATTVLPSGSGYLTLYPSDAARPTVASSNYAGNDVINGPFAVNLGADGKFKIYTFSTTHLVVDITGYYSASPLDANGAGLLFNPLPKPMRLLETRPDFPGFPLTGCYRTNAAIAGQPNIRSQPVSGTCSDQPITIPNTARAIVGNATAINPVAAGFLTFFPGDVATAPTVATSNYPFPVTFGYNRHYYVGLSGTDGIFKALTQFTTDLIVDVAGYFAP